jgi:6-phosphogluconolactonase/glucosamine-6-phosphate isomerase/deaminase
MEFIRSRDGSEGTKALTKRLITELKKNQPVLWLVSGGSNIKASVEVMKALPDELTKDLAIFLSDERYGEVGHIHSNAKQLLDAGFLPKQALFVPTLAPGFSLEETKQRYEQAIQRAFEHAKVIISQLGIGADGHIAGILPHSEAAHADGWVAAYETHEHTRVTLTFHALKHITADYSLVFGEEKKHALEQLRDESLSLADEPSQILKELSEAYVYNDQVGEE